MDWTQSNACSVPARTTWSSVDSNNYAFVTKKILLLLLVTITPRKVVPEITFNLPLWPSVPACVFITISTSMGSKLANSESSALNERLHVVQSALLMFSLHFARQLKSFSHSLRYPVFRLPVITYCFFSTEKKNSIYRVGKHKYIETNVDKQQPTFFLSMVNFINFSEIYLKFNLYWASSNLFSDQ